MPIKFIDREWNLKILRSASARTEYIIEKFGLSTLAFQRREIILVEGLNIERERIIFQCLSYRQ